MSTLEPLAKALRVPIVEFFVTKEQSELLRQGDHAANRVLVSDDDTRSVERRLLKRLASLIRDAADKFVQ